MENRLVHLEDFREVLSTYTISEHSKSILSNTVLVAMVAPSSAGRNTIIRELLKSGNYHYIVSDTTRQKRVNDGIKEKDGVEYWFRSEEAMLEDLRQGLYVEAALIHNQQVSGISIRELEKAHDEHKAALTDIEIVGLENIITVKPDTFALFILPPSFDIWMTRMDARGLMPLAEKRRRLASSIQEFTSAIDNDYYTFIINNDFHESVRKIHSLVSENTPSSDQELGRKLAKDLRTATERWLYVN